MKKKLSYVGLLLLAGTIFGAIVTGLVWMQHLYDLSVSYYLFTATFWLGMAATVLFGIWLRRYFQQLSKFWVFFSVLTALFAAYLFPKSLTPTCSEIPTVKAGCTETCVMVCIDYELAGTGRCPAIPDLPNPDWDKGCCWDYAESCTKECTWYPPTVSGYTTCSIFGNDGWCVENGQLHMSGTDPEHLTITISGTMVGQAFSCAPGYSCVKTLIEGNGDAIFHSYNGHLSSGNFAVAYKYDATPPNLTPSVTGTSGSNGWYTSTISVATSATDAVSGVANSQIRLLSGTWQDSVDFTTEGTHSFEMSALDVAGNEATLQAQVKIDTVPPVQEIGITSGTLGTNGYYIIEDVIISAISGDATSGVASIVYRIDGGVWQNGADARLAFDGTHTVEFVTTDYAGLTDTDSMTVKIDKTNPVITISPSGTVGLNGWYVSYVDVDASATDATSGIALLEYSVNNSAWLTWAGTITLPDGEYDIDVYTEDNASNYLLESIEINVDTIPPVPDVQPSGTAGLNDWYRSDVSWQATATDATSGVASIEVNPDAAAWNYSDTASFTTEGPHTVDFRFTDEAGNYIITNNSFSIDKTPPTISIDSPSEGNVVSRITTINGHAADALSGLVEVAVSPNGGSTWNIIPWETDGSWTYDWDTTRGPNGVFALIARTTDRAGNITTDQVNVIVDNAPPTVTLTESWEIWETARGSVFKNVIPLSSKKITVNCGDQPNRVIEYNANEGAFDFKWDRRCGDGNLAPSGSYTVVLEACDIYDNCDEARGNVDIPFVAAIIAPPTATPMPTIEETETEKIWYNTPTAVPSSTPTPQIPILPVIPSTGGDESGDGNVPTGTDQPLLPLAAAALGTSVLLAASSKREEREAQAAARLEDMQKNSTEDQSASQEAREASVAAQTVATVNEETPYVEVSTLAALAGVVKETFEGIWEDAVRISPADAPITIVTHNWVNGVDPIAYYEENGARLAAKAKFWNDYWIASQKKYIEEQRLLAIKEAEEAAAKAKAEYENYAENMRLIASTGGRAVTDLSGEQLNDFISQNAGAAQAAYTYYSQQIAAVEAREKSYNNSAAAEFDEKQAKYDNYYATAYQEQKEKEEAAEAVDALNKKMTRDEENTEDKNVFQMDYSEMMKKFHEKESQDIEDYKEQQWNEKINSFTVPDYMKTSYLGTGPTAESVFTPDDELQEVIDKNIAKQAAGKPTIKDIFVNILNSTSAFAGKVYDAFRTPTEIKDYRENYGPVSPSFGGAPGSYNITYDGNPFGGYTVEQVKAEYNTEMSDAAAAFILSMIPIIGDGSGIIKEFYNLLMTGEMDELNFTLSVIGLGMDLPFDGGIFGDTAVATLKAASTMVPSGPARQVLLEALQQVGKNPEGLITLAGAFGKMAGKDDLMKIITSNPEVFKAYLNGGKEAAENILKYEDEIIQAGKAIDEDTLKAIMEGSEDALKSADEAAEILTDGSHLVTDSKGKTVGLKPNVTYKAGEFDYIYKTDDIGRLTTFETDNLQLTTRDTRLTHNPNTPGKGTTDAVDHAGHVAGDRFGGSPELDNLVSQAQNVNLSEYKIIENQWANAIENGQKVTVNMKINYDPVSMRPISFDVSYTIDDVPFFQTINN